ncbi:uncharacterized protein BJ171DRAFT_493593 [Polychytrium aggregatum]|uniref:uncharacterized protein n=1 Tax=Polychytrium aggregatum TaxID=110093 RepID=UPI0022FDC6FA|nr:uncharacterized protein BJ171DRAFT_493593 [Polychytrium aggregatum]KAI9207707.1 hypothetical protein BJ171DRAFT_493593 [Polychytrium aggregatum]
MPPQPVAPMRNTLTFMQSALPAPMEISGFNASTSDLSIQSVSPPEPPISEMTPSASYHVEKELMDHSAEFNMIENARPTFETLTRARRTATEKKPSTMTPEQELELLKIRSQSGENDDIFEYAKFCATYIPSNNDSKLRDKVAEEGFRLLKKLSKEDYAEAQYWLGRAYSEDDSHNLAFAQFLLAAKRDHPGATFAVGVCYEGGKGSRKDPKAAMTFYRKAAAAAYPPAMYRMGMICLRGELGQKRDIRDGVKWLKRCAAVADTDNPHALMQLSILHETGLPPAVHTDHKYSLQLLMQAANLGFPPAQFRLGQCYEYGSLTCVVDPRESLRWYTVAAEAGEQEAQFALAGWFLTGHLDQIPKDERAALMWTEKAAQAGFPKAQYAMGFFYETGLSILPPDQARAKQWYEIAAANGDERAHQRLTGQPITGSSKRPSKDSKQGSCTIM